MTPFLKKVAETFIEKAGRLDRTCFVFPNRRSGAFFRKYLRECSVNPMIFPEVQTISDFIGSHSGLIDAGRIEQLFALYDSYLKVAGHVDFDRFLYWGDMILGDFNDVDRYMVDARELFVNIENLKSINADFLTESQREVIKNFFGEYRVGGTENLWIGDEGKKRYFRLWSVLNDLYEEFKLRLKGKGLSYSGLTYHVAAEKIKEKSKDDFEFERIVFIGFSTLSKSEEVIFNHLKNIGIGDFYWDFNSPVFSDPENKGTVFLREYVKEFPSCYDIGEEPACSMLSIRVISVPSGAGQSKVAAHLIEQLVESRDIENPEDAIDTAIVLPDEKYLGSVLRSVPESIGTMNVTMGYPMANTAVASFMRMIAVAFGHKRVRNGIVSFYYEDLENLLSHPYVVALCGKEIDEFKRAVIERRLFFVDIGTIVELLPSLADVFGKVEFSSSLEIVSYVRKVIETVGNKLSIVSECEDLSLERYFICKYVDSLVELESMIKDYSMVEMSEKTFFFLIDRMTSGATVAFEGEPMHGLQIMGVLETRLLDFKNLIIFSMNEKVFPSKHYTRSFIPESLRAAYGISTYHKQDSMFTYYFYRMISRAENVFLLYDSRTQGVSTGEVSRYVSQLRRIYNRGKCEEYAFGYNVLLPVEPVIEVEKTPRVMERIIRYTLPDTSKNFSASMINTYVECPLKFYFKYVEDIREEDEINDFIDSATFGTIVHEIMQAIYDAVPLTDGKKIVRHDYLENLSSPESFELQKIIGEVVSKEYDKNKDGGGDVEVIKNIIAYYIVPVLRHDMSLTPFEYVGSEIEQSFRWRLDDDLTINYKQIIDRLDKVDGTLRIVDYKTGKDEVNIKSFDSIFDAGKSGGHQKAVLQILLYCNAYSEKEKYGGDIKPVIYKIRDVRLLGDERFCLKYESNPIISYNNSIFKDGFMEKIRMIVREILNSDVKFTRTADRKKCLYCQFAEACNRN